MLLGNLLYTLLFTRKAATRGFAGWPAACVASGVPSKLETDWTDRLMERITGAGYGMEGFFRAPCFPEFQAGVQWYLKQKPEKAITVSPRGPRIHAEVIENEEPSDLWLICLHGYTSCPWANGIIAEGFYARGFNILLPHLCGHGDSEDSFVSMGWLDRLDVRAWADFLIRAYGNPRIVLYGASMGAATAMMATGEALPRNVACAIADCGFTSLWDLLYGVAATALPGALTTAGLHSLDAATRLRAGFSIKDASCVEQVKKSKTPTLFIHGDADRGVPPWMQQTLYDAAACEKEMLLVPGAGHAEAMYSTDLFYGAIDKFLGRYLSLSIPRSHAIMNQTAEECGKTARKDLNR